MRKLAKHLLALDGLMSTKVTMTTQTIEAGGLERSSKEKKRDMADGPSPASGHSSRSSRQIRIWPTISAAVRLRPSFCVPVWQHVPLQPGGAMSVSSRPHSSPAPAPGLPVHTFLKHAVFIEPGRRDVPLQSLLTPYAAECNGHEVIIQDPYLCHPLRDGGRAGAVERCTVDEAAVLYASLDLSRDTPLFLLDEAITVLAAAAPRLLLVASQSAHSTATAPRNLARAAAPVVACRPGGARRGLWRPSCWSPPVC